MSSIADSRSPARLFPLLIAAAVLLLLLRVPLAGLPALWIDEAFSLYHARMPLAQIWGEGWRLESSPPLYYTALWAWIRIAADTEPSGRLLSLLLTGVSAVFVYRAARTLSGPTAGAVAACVWLLPALGVEFSVEIRPYAMQQSWVAIATASLVSAISVWSAGRLRARGDVLKCIVPIVLAATAAFYTHTTSIAFITGLASAGLYYGWVTGAGRTYMQIWAGACICVVLLCVPQFLAASEVLASNRAGLAWIPSSLDQGKLFMLAQQWVLGSVWWQPWISVPLTVPVFALLAAGAWHMRRRADVTAVCTVLALTGAAVLVLAGLIQSVLMPRTALWLWVPMAILSGCAVVTIGWQSLWRRGLMLALVALFLVTGLLYVAGRAKQRPWRDTIVALAERVKPGDRILVIDPELACMVDHYAVGPLREIPRLRLRTFDNRFQIVQRLDIVCNRLPIVDEPQIAPMPGAGDWIMTDGGWHSTTLELLLQRSEGRLRIDETVRRAGQGQLTRLVPVDKPAVVGQ